LASHLTYTNAQTIYWISYLLYLEDWQIRYGFCCLWLGEQIYH